MNKEHELADQLRMQLLGGLHVGILRPGSKLPSIRETAERHGIDHRAVARAYAQLEADRLVEIRGRSGVYVAAAETTMAGVIDERLSWFATVLRDNWSRRITFAEFNNLARRTALHQLRCVCLETTVDHLVAFSSELASDFGFTVVPIRFMQRHNGTPEASDLVRIETELRAADAVATTAFHTTAVTEMAQRVGKPMITISINPGIRDAIAGLIREGPVRVVVADTAFQDRARLFLHQIPGSQNVELMRACDYKRLGRDDKRTVFTKAARRELGLAEFHLIAPDVPFISPESASDICALIVHLVSSLSRTRAASALTG